MLTLEDIVALFGNTSALRPYSLGRRYSYSIFGQRLLLSRGPASEYEMFVVGSQGSFGTIPASAGVQWGTYHEPGGQQIDALRMALPDDSGNCRLVAHLAYEAYQRLHANSGISNADLLLELQPYVGLVTDRGLLSPQEQQGLLGELLLLERLIGLCQQGGLTLTNALDSWKGCQRAARRDFGRNGIAVEVKTTAKAARIHEISSLSQLELDPQENRLYLYSLSVTQDPSGPLKLCGKVNDLLGLLGQDAPIFVRQLLARGYDTRLAGAYRLSPTFTTTQLTAALFEVDQTLSRVRLSSFVGGGLPTNVHGVSYTLDLSGVTGANNPRPPAAADHELSAMLT